MITYVYYSRNIYETEDIKYKTFTIFLSEFFIQLNLQHIQRKKQESIIRAVRSRSREIAQPRVPAAVASSNAFQFSFPQPLRSRPLSTLVDRTD